MNAPHSDPDPEFRDLAAVFLEGDLDEVGLARLEVLLREAPQRVRVLREELAFADLLAQSLTPHRSFQAFLDGLETRFHAEATADAFLADLLPRLREVDQRAAATKVVRFPVAWTVGLSAAAAVVLAGVIAFRPGQHSDAPGIAHLGQTSQDIVWARDDQHPGAIEWKPGTAIPAGTSIRLESGTARIDLPNGNVLTVEGPADFLLHSSSEGSLHHGNLMATVAGENAPFTVRASDMEFRVAGEGAATGIRTLERNGLEAAMLSGTGSLTAGPSGTGGQENAIRPNEALVTRPQDGLRETIPVDPAAYRSHFDLLAGVSEHSDSVSVDLPELSSPLPHRTPVVVSLEPERMAPDRPVSVDVTPEEPLPLAHARTLPVERRPDIAPGQKLRSYVVEVSPLEPAASGVFDAFVRFDQPILGIAATPDTLGGAVTGLAEADSLSIGEDGRTLHLRLRTADRDALSRFRVYVREPAIILPSGPDRAWATPPTDREEKPDLSGKAP